MANTNTSLPYAEALFALAQNGGEGGTALVDSLVNQLTAISKNKEFQSLINNPDLKDTEVVDFILMLVKLLKNDNVRNFVASLPEISSDYYKLRSSVKSKAMARITSAYPMSEEEINQLLPGLEKRFGRKLNPSVTVDSSLIGGIRVVVDDEVLDLSVSTKLQKMEEAIAS